MTIDDIRLKAFTDVANDLVGRAAQERMADVFRAIVSEIDAELTQARTVGSNSSGYRLGLSAARRVVLRHATAAGIDLDGDSK